MPQFLSFTLSGPMAAWGDIAPGEQRGSWSRPSKSAVLGLVAAALGIRRDEPERLAALHRGLGFAVLVEKAGRLLEDYHTAQAPTEVALKRRGKTLGRDQLTWGEALAAEVLNTTLSKRSYFVEARYLAILWQRDDSEALSLDETGLDEIGRALAKPKFHLYLGRKSCPLSRPPAPRVVEAPTVEALLAENQAFAHDDADLWCDADVPSALAPQARGTRRDAWRGAEPWRHDPRPELLLQKRGGNTGMTPTCFTRATLRLGAGSRGALAKLLTEAAVPDNGHRLVWSLFAKGERRAFLYRRISPERFLILSAAPPQDDSGLWRLETKDWVADLAADDRLGFQLCVNATVSKSTPRPEAGPRPRGRRKALAALVKAQELDLTEAAAAWLLPRLPGAGLEAGCLTARSEAKVTIQPSKDRTAYSFDPLLLEGLLRVEDPEAFKTALAKGIGRSKAYGFGLLLIRRV
ncbi:MAG: type I-E CRISPR-associated protein Cas5/CasD [Rhodospirillales bacterium]|nr:type I-E CRISPR-associated protein Cas5/CasD [Rhodospirillales bacterium]